MRKSELKHRMYHGVGAAFCGFAAWVMGLVAAIAWAGNDDVTMVLATGFSICYAVFAAMAASEARRSWGLD